MRLIDADELLKKMDLAIAMMERTMIALDIEDDAEAQMELKAYKDIRNGINDEPTVHPESNWISCKDRLPESFQEVLVCGDNGAMDIIIGFTVDGIEDTWVWQLTPKLVLVKKIVAWQPLPESYKEMTE